MKVLVADTFEPSGLEGLRAAGCEVVYEPDLEGERLVQALAQTEAEVLIVRSTRVTAAMLDAGRVALVVRAGAGYDTIDVAAASARGIYVANCPGRNAIAVAELAFGLIVALDRRIPDNVEDLRRGRWRKREYAKARGLYGRTLGLLGLGPIAIEMIRRAAAFGMPVVVWSRRFDGEDRPLEAEEARALGLEEPVRVHLAPTPAEVAARADVLSLHLARAPETRRLVNADVLGRLKPGAYVVNTARAELLDYAALEAAVREKGLRVALDVFEDEPQTGVAEFHPPVVALPGVYGTHHIGASTEQAQEAIAAETVRIVRTYRDTGRVPNAVNLARRSPATARLVVRHRDRPGVLAHVFDHLRRHQLNVQETENIVFEGAQAAVAHINVDVAPSAECLAAIRAHADILDVRVIPV
jgi:D-3-phosphoglycerate dehydrogenase